MVTRKNHLLNILNVPYGSLDLTSVLFCNNSLSYSTTGLGLWLVLEVIFLLPKR